MAELVARYPDRFVYAVVALSLNDIDAFLKEMDRAINDRPLDSPELMPFYGRMTHYNLPIFLHPRRLHNVPDYLLRKNQNMKYFRFLDGHTTRQTQ